MSSKEKTNKITSFFKPRTNKDTETNEEGDKLNSENSSIIANSNDQASEINYNKKHTKNKCKGRKYIFFYFSAPESRENGLRRRTRPQVTITAESLSKVHKKLVLQLHQQLSVRNKS